MGFYYACFFTESVEACMKNIQLNGSVASSKVNVHLADSRVYMLMHPKEFEAVKPFIFISLQVLIKIMSILLKVMLSVISGA